MSGIGGGWASTSMCRWTGTGGGDRAGRLPDGRAEAVGGRVGRMILVTGATGNVGSELVTILAGAGRPVRAMVRTSRTARDGVEQVVGDLNDAASLRAAVDGVRAVFLLGGYDDMPGALAAFRD